MRYRKQHSQILFSSSSTITHSSSSLGMAPSSTTNNNNNKRKLCHINNAPPMVTSRKKRASCLNNKQEGEGEKSRTWECSTALVLYDDPWKIKKVLEKSDIGNMSRLLLPRGLAEDLVVSVLGDDARRNVESERGIEVSIWDLDTESMHKLVFKRWGSSRSYVFIGNWVKDFVSRRGLMRGDEVGFHWNPYKNHFNFTVLVKAEGEDEGCI